MPRFAANLSTLFNELPFLDRFEAAARAGFQAVELAFPYGHPARELRSRLAGNGLQLVQHSLPTGHDEAGACGIACQPERVAEFHAGIAHAIAYAQALGVQQLHCPLGQAPAGLDRAAVRRTLVANLRFTAVEFRRAGLTLLIEPTDLIDLPGYAGGRTADALRLIDDIEAGNVFLQFDLYHAQRTEGDLAATLQNHLPRIAHLQAADNPGRHEPGTGEINYSFLFRHIDRLGYTGWIGCEYQPATTTAAGLGWRAPYLAEEEALA